MLNNGVSMKHDPKATTVLYDQKTIGRMAGYKFVKTDRGLHSSLSTIEGMLRKFDLSTNEIRIYLYLARSGFPCKAREISDSLSLHRTETYKILRKLEKRGLISSVFEKPMKFLAVPFEKTIGHLIETKRMRISMLEREKSDLLAAWSSIPKFDKEPVAANVFQILEGKEQVTLKLKGMIEKTRQEVCVFASRSDLMRFHYWGILDELEDAMRKDVEIRLLADYSSKSRFFLNKTSLSQKKCVNAPEIEDLPCFMISDRNQVLFRIKESGVESEGPQEKREKIRFLWTNYDSFVRVLWTLFPLLWNTETNASHVLTI